MKAVITKILSINGENYTLEYDVHNNGEVLTYSVIVNLPEDSNQPYKKQLITDAVKAVNVGVEQVLFSDFSIS